MPIVAFAQTAAPAQVNTGNFFTRLYQAYVDDINAPNEAPTASGPAPKCLPPPYDVPPMPSADYPYGGNPGMCQDGTPVNGPLMRALAPTSVGKFLTDNKIAVYGWIEPSGNFSSSKGKNGNSPSAYAYNANSPLLNQVTLYVERLPDTTQTDHWDYGFRVTGLYGSDYRYTTMYGLDSNNYLDHNHQTGADLPMAYLELYDPHLGYGTNFRLGRYISLPDIEAQLAPDNYFFTHSLLYAYDPYTQIGLVATTKLDEKGQWIVQYGLSAGNDTTPWAANHAAIPTATFTVRYTTEDNMTNYYAAANSINNGKFGYNNLQSYYLTIYHRFNDKLTTATEAWYMYQYKTPATNGATAGSQVGLAMPFVNSNGTPFGYGTANGPYGAYCKTGSRCTSYEEALLNYTIYQIDHRNFIGIRNEIFNDATAQRTGFKTIYYETTIGWNHDISDDIQLRPEIGYYHAFNAKAFSNGTRKDMVMGAMDIIFHY
jgi:hypothetical protein